MHLRLFFYAAATVGALLTTIVVLVSYFHLGVPEMRDFAALSVFLAAIAIFGYSFNDEMSAGTKASRRALTVVLLGIGSGFFMSPYAIVPLVAASGIALWLVREEGATWWDLSIGELGALSAAMYAAGTAQRMLSTRGDEEPLALFSIVAVIAFSLLVSTAFLRYGADLRFGKLRSLVG